MKILLLPAYFYPEQAASSYLGDNIRQAMCESGAILELYAPMPTRGISKEVREEYKKRRMEHWHDGKLEIHRFLMYGEGKNPILRALRYVFCWCAQFWKGLRAKDIDLIYLASTPPIQGVLGGLLKKIKKVPFVYNLQDIFPDSLAGTGLAKKDGLLWKIGRVIENFTYRNADKIIVISEDFKRNIMEKGVPEEKIVVVYNWVDEEAVKHVPREENKLFDMYGLDRKKFYVTYSGNIGLTQNMDMLLEVAKELEEDPNIQFVLIGEGAYKKRVEEIIAEKNIGNVTLLPFQPYEDISHVFSLGDAGLVISKPGVGENSVPSKTWSILSASRPVLANFDENELKTIVSENQCGIFTKAGDKETFKQAILDLYHDREHCEQLGRNGREFILKNLTRAVGTQKYVDVIKSFEKA
ncbi:MAG: glycosyltransferase family 4 protein [Bacteroidaceae bacterium]|nr:glycosyltransferase family 4 protein [Bacteroidaceae bacterium]